MQLVGLLTFFLVLTLSAATETVWLRELNVDNDKRGIAGVPLELEIKHASGKTRLNLQENKRVNPNAPVFNVFEEPGTGKQMLVQQTGSPKLKTRFFQDKENSGAFMLNYDEHDKRNIVSGVFRRGEQFYSLTPAPTLKTSKLDMAIRGAPYLLDEETANVGRHTTDDAARVVYDARETTGKRQTIDELLEEIRSLLGEERVQRIEKKLTRRKRAENVYAVELVIVIDHTVWRTFYERSVASGSLNQTEVTKENLRQHFVHIVNGMSLRYESIEDPAMNIYLTISGFIFYETRRNSTNPLPMSTHIPNIDGTELVSAYTYLDALVPWAANLTGLPPNDHILVFTDYDLYSRTTDRNGRGTAGLAWVGGVCGSHRMSINEFGPYFVTVSVAAHELGHNLGSSHDGGETTRRCGTNTKYVMAPRVPSFRRSDPYTPNPWTFSSCSIDQFKAEMTALGSSNCLLDNGDYFDKAEYEAHAQMLPGQLHTADQQCKLERGPSSEMCTRLTSPTNVNFCHAMSCRDSRDGFCYFYVPARGTDCGDTGDEYCIDGQCVPKDPKYSTAPVTTSRPAITRAPVTTSRPATTNAPFTTSRPATTNAPVTTSRPATTNAPFTTSRPATTNAPFTTSRPATTNAPFTTSRPATTNAPVTTSRPATTNAPFTTSRPATTNASFTTWSTTTNAPFTTSRPATTNAPFTTSRPATTNAPVTTRTPATTNAPVTTRTPATTNAPVTTRTPATTNAPVTTRTPTASCLDSGYYGYSCSKIFGWFQNIGVGPRQVCRYPTWDRICCAKCKANGS